MPMRHGGKAAISSSSLPRGTLGQTSTGLPVASTPCTAKTFYPKSIPIVTIVMDFPFKSELMRHCTSHRGTKLLIAVAEFIARDGEVPFIRYASEITL